MHSHIPVQTCCFTSLFPECSRSLCRCCQKLVFHIPVSLSIRQHMSPAVLPFSLLVHKFKCFDGSVVGFVCFAAGLLCGAVFRKGQHSNWAGMWNKTSFLVIFISLYKIAPWNLFIAQIDFKTWSWWFFYLFWIFVVVCYHFMNFFSPPNLLFLYPLWLVNQC